eukprot:gene11100-14848_t
MAAASIADWKRTNGTIRPLRVALPRGYGGRIFFARLRADLAAVRICMLGATGTIGRATVAALVRDGHDVVCFVRASAGRQGTPADAAGLFDGATIRVVDVADPVSLARDGFAGERFDAVVSCMASRTGAPKDAWAVDYRAHLDVLVAAQQAGVGHFVLLSAICVQKPLLAFQHAKLAFEATLIESGMHRARPQRQTLPDFRRRHPDRLALAARMGATRTVDVSKENLTDVQREIGMKEGFDVGLEMSGNPVALNTMIDNMAHGGRIALRDTQAGHGDGSRPLQDCCVS